MNFRQTAILIGAVFAVVVVLLVLTFTGEDNTPATDALTEELAGVSPDDIDTVEMERDTGSRLKLVRTGKNKWELVEPFRTPADGMAVQAVVTALMRAKPTASNELSSSPATHGLEPPSLKVTLRRGDKSSTVNLGEVSFGGSRGLVFVTTSARPKRPMAVPRGELDALFREPKSGKAADLAKWVGDFRTKSVFPAESRAQGEDVVALKLSLPNKKHELALSRVPGRGWKFDVPAGWGSADPDGAPTGAPATFTGVGPLLSALTNVAALSPADFIDEPKDLKDYGLNPDNPDRIRVEMKTKDGQTTVVYFGKMEAGVAPPPIPGMPPQPPGGKVYVSIEGQPGVIRASAANLSGLAGVITDPNPLRDRDLIRVERGKSVDGIDIHLAGQAPDKPTRLRKVGNDWKLFGGPNDPQNALAATVMKIVDVVTAKRSIKDFPPQNNNNFSANTAVLYVWVDGFNPPPDPKAEPVKKGEPIKLEFGRKDGDTLYVKRTLPGGQVNEFALPAAIRVGGGTEPSDVLAAVSKTRLDLLDPSLPTFSDEAVLRVAVTGQANYTLEKAEKPDPYTGKALWQFTAPEPKGRTADAPNLLHMLNLLGTTQSVSRFVDEQPTPEKLAEYGFTPAPRLKVVIGLKGEERVYEFGKDTADPAMVYARIGGRSAVFTLPRLIFEKFASPDLRDRFLFRFEPAKATAVEIRGWNHLKLGEQKLRFERNKDGIWVGTVGDAKQPFAGDPAKVEQFLRALAHTRVEEFIAGNAQKPEYGFGDANYLVVTVTTPTGAVYVNIGAATANGSKYFGYTTALPATDPFFTMDAAPLKPFKESPAGFAK
jgi:hypothetical protein